MSAPTNTIGKLSSLQIGGAFASNVAISAGSTVAGIVIDSSGNASIGGALNSANLIVGKNRVINGDMNIDQRNVGAAKVQGSMTAASAASNYTLDRWQAVTGPASGSLVAQQVSLSAADQAAAGLSKAVQLSQVPMNGLIAYYPLDGNANDASGNGFNGTLTGSSYSTFCRVGSSSLNLTGNPTSGTGTNYMTATVSGLSTKYTICGWIYTTYNSTGAALIFNYGPTYAKANSLYYSSGTIYYGLYSSGSSSGGTNNWISGTVAINTWAHVALTYDSTVSGTNTYLFINGSQVSSNTNSGVLNTTQTNGNLFTVGNSSDQSGFIGYIDEVRIYNRALSATEIAALAGNVGIPQAPPSNFVQPLDYTSRLTFDSTTADATGLLPAPTVTGTVVYNTSLQQIGSACLDLTANTPNNVGPTYTSSSAFRCSYPVSSLALPVSVSFWMYTNNNTINYQCPFELTPSSGWNSGGLHLLISSSGLWGDANIAGTTYSTGYVAVNTNTWYHMCCTLGYTGLYVYVNGALATSVSTASSGAWSPSQLTIGSGWDHPERGFKGYLDDFRIYNRALSAPEIALLAGNVSVPPTLATTNLTTLLTFDSTTADAQGALGAPTATGTTTYNTSLQKVGTACLDLSTNVAGTTLNRSLQYSYTAAVPITVSAWIYPTNPTQGGVQQIVAFGGSSPVDWAYSIFLYTSGQVYTQSWVGANVSVGNTAATAVPANTWTHVCCTLASGGLSTIYINGVLQASGAVGTGTLTVASTSTAASIMTIGSRFGAAGSAYQGYIDDFRIYNTVLTHAQVLSLSQKQNLSMQFTFNNTSADAMGSVAAPTIAAGSITYNANCKVGAASLDLTGNAANITAHTKAANYFYYSNPPVPTGAQSWSVWLNFSQVPGSGYYSCIMNVGPTSTAHIGFFIDGGSGFKFQAAGTSTAGTAYFVPSVNTWYHFVGVYVPSTSLSLYVNGSLFTSYTTSIAATTGNSGNLYIGDVSIPGNLQPYAGYLDDLRLYSSALTPAQIAGLYYSSPNTGYVLYQQPIEGLNVADLALGTSSAQAATVSAWIKNNSAASNAQALTLAVNNGNQGLSMWVPFDNNSSAEVMGGATGPAITGTASYVSGKVGSTAVYLANEANVTTTPTKASNMLTYAYNVTGSITVSCWLYCTKLTQNSSTGNGFPWAFSSTSNFSLTSVLTYSSATTANLVATYNGVANTPGMSISANTWYHQVVVYVPGVSVSNYVNGVLMGSFTTSVPASLGSSNGYFSLGDCYTTTYTSPFAGYFDDVRIYNKVLTPAQIQQLYINNASSTTLTPYMTPRSVIYQTPSLPANAWSRVAVTLPGDVLGSWAADNSLGLNLALCLGAGANYSSSNVAAASNNGSNVWQNALVYTASNQVFGASNAFLGNLGNSLLVTGVQLERGSGASSFEILPLTTELASCQRYFEKSYQQVDAVGAATVTNSVGWGLVTGSQQPVFGAGYKTPKRTTAPSVTVYNPNSGASGTVRNVDQPSDGTVVISGASENGFGIAWASANTGQTIGQQIGAHYTADAEL